MRNSKTKIVSDINVTSLLDIAFVLLIVFIIAAPFMRAGVKVDLPGTVAPQPQPPRAIVVTVSRTGEAFVDGERTALDGLGASLAAKLKRVPNQPVLIEGDTRAEYGKIVAVMDVVRQTGIQNVGLILEPLAARAK
ncbi:MAG: biopolymer transporter ExbD [candidate division KSB1 bacterium]|nr:biopolymer transporter ExbD [candidate division KSB1 bacterium]MDZ7275271.1 biopolymer transporter ExbD [candidate division KSB1 bacterium]MDZ7287439.1 biopolymer transporter ExbD [candidate division KSB1 bacterium]MDZ7299553.1 biopolymer transporter ExbD [candidate division KSB1 bacterium]MDZ7308011.1 biopolymer transporter ExbD [candidate division KSB1 bacterium]